LTEFSQSQTAAADQHLRRAVELRPDNPYYHCFLGMMLISTEKNTGQYVEAQKEIERSIRLRPSYALAHYQLGRLLVRENDYADARRELEKAVALQADFPEAYFQLAHAYTRLGEKEKSKAALAEFQKYHGEEYSERQEVLKQAQQAVQGQ